VDEYLSEKEQIEKLRNWWSDNGSWVIAGIVLGVALLVGWNAWQSYVIRRAEDASALYTQLSGLIEKGELVAAERDQALDIGQRLKANYAATPYDEQGALALAGLNVDAGFLDEAAAELEYVIENSGDAELALVARLRLARVRVQQGRLDGADAALVTTDPGALAAGIAEWRGDIAYARGDIGGARSAYQEALTQGDAGVVNRVYVQMKLDDLADPAAPEPQEAAATDDSTS